MDLNTLWFILIGVLFSGFFVLEGFDFGVGIMLPFLGKDDVQRRIILNSIGPFWDGNEVWLLTAGGAIFAAFPNWYATMFSAFYLAFVALLVALIVRGIAIEFRSKDRNPKWRSFWDWSISISCIVCSILIGVAFSNLIFGLPINEKQQFTGNFFSLLSPYTIFAGVFSLVAFLIQGNLFLALKIEGMLAARAKAIATKLSYYIPIFIFGLILIPLIAINSERFHLITLIPIVGFVVSLLLIFCLKKDRVGLAFTCSSVLIIIISATIFSQLFPSVMVSSENMQNNLNIYNTASTPYTLSIMSWIALVFVPIVLAYQGYTYFVFRKRLTRDSSLHY